MPQAIQRIGLTGGIGSGKSTVGRVLTACGAALVDADAMVRPAELVEDELILALPVVAIAPDADVVERDFAPTSEETAAVNPFTALAGLKKN